MAIFLYGMLFIISLPLVLTGWEWTIPFCCSLLLGAALFPFVGVFVYSAYHTVRFLIEVVIEVATQVYDGVQIELRRQKELQKDKNIKKS